MVETLYDAAIGFSFLDMNARPQAEHALSEEVTGIDMMQFQIRLAACEHLNAIWQMEIQAKGHAIEVRIYVEDSQHFLPSPGTLSVFLPPKGEDIRVETVFAEGNTIAPYYDLMIAKTVIRGIDRGNAIKRILGALEPLTIVRVNTYTAFANQTLKDEHFCDLVSHTGLLTAYSLGDDLLLYGILGKRIRMVNTKIESEVTGTICKTKIMIGKMVMKDDLLPIVRSMKMKIAVTAQATGRILETKVAEGDTVTDQKPRTPIWCRRNAAVHFVRKQGAGCDKMHGSGGTRPAGTIDTKSFCSWRSPRIIATNRTTRTEGGNRS